MTLVYFYTLMGAVVSLISAWTVITSRFSLKFYTKLAICLLCLSSFANIGWVWMHKIEPTQGDVAFMFAVMVLAIRCYCIKYVRPRVREHKRKR